MEKEFRKILAEISGYDEQELKDRQTEILIQPFDCLLAMNQALNIQNVSVSVFCVTDEISECIISVHRTRLDAEDAIKENLNSSLDLYVDEVDL